MAAEAMSRVARAHRCRAVRAQQALFVAALGRKQATVVVRWAQAAVAVRWAQAAAARHTHALMTWNAVRVAQPAAIIAVRAAVASVVATVEAA